MTEHEYDDVWQMLNSYLDDWGLGSLSDQAKQMAISGDPIEIVTLKLRDTPEYKERFKANDDRKKRGLPVLSPADYVEMERQYQGILRKAGLPQGFYDNLDDYTKWISGDVSPDELNDRVQIATEDYQNAPAEIRNQWQQLYGLTPSHALAAILDEDRALPLLQRQARSVNIAAQAQKAFETAGGYQLSQTRAEELERAGVTAQQAMQGFGDIAASGQRNEFLARLSGQTLTRDEEERAGFLGDATAQAKIKKAQDEEEARFKSNFLAQGEGGLSRATGGSY
ncbi:MAG: hypothetical protein ACRDSH_13045 [Pseudonocardiaceae bacterium]